MKYLSNVASLELYADRCTGCGICVEVCPHNVLTITENKALILDKDLCMECSACMQNCQFEAIRVDRGVGCAAALINSLITGGEPSCDCGGSEKTQSCC